MTDARPRHWLASLVLDLLPWVLASGSFLWSYVHLFDRPAASIVPHLRIVATTWLALSLLKLVSLRITGVARRTRLILALICALPLTLLLLHYMLNLVGLSSWGRVPTWPLLQAYALQNNELMEALGYTQAAPFIAIILLLVVCFWSQATWASGEAWAKELLRRLGNRMLLPVMTGLLLVVSLQTWRIITFPAVASEEPLALTFVAAPSRQLQNHAAAGTAGDEAEEASRRNYKNADSHRRSNVILIVGDALRSDHLGLYGYTRPVTPKLDALIERQAASVAPRIRATCAESSCGLLAMAASRYVHQLPTRPITLQEVVRKHGYRVHLILGGDHTHFYGLREAYGTVDSYFDGRMQSTRYMNDDQLVVDRAAQLPDASEAGPVLLQFHLMSSHGLGKRHEASNRYQPSGNYYRHVRGLRTVSPELREEAVNYYDNGMIQLDTMLSSLLTTLKAKGYLNDALVVLTGDHGEMLGEHGMLSHANGVHEDVLDIPFVLMGFGRDVQPFASRKLATQVDIAPTILHELSMPIPETWRGQPLQTAETRTTIFFQQGRRTGLYDLSDSGHLWKYWRDWDAGDEWVYDVDRDPNESNNLVGSTNRSRLIAWRREVAANLSAAGSEDANQLTE